MSVDSPLRLGIINVGVIQSSHLNPKNVNTARVPYNIMLVHLYADHGSDIHEM